MAELTARLAGFGPLRLQPDWLARLRTIQQPVSDGGPLIYELKPSSSVTFTYRGPPAEYRINSEGMRSDRIHARPKPAGVRRILCLGDSVLFGLGVPIEDVFSSKLETMLPGCEVMNTGVGGYNTYSERIWLETRGATYQPDDVIVCYCPNDVDEPLEQFAIQVDQKLPEFPPDSIPNPAYHADVLKRHFGPSAHSAEPGGLSGLMLKFQKRSALVNLCLEPFAYGRRSRSHERCLIAVADKTSPEHAWLGRQLAGLAQCAIRLGAKIYFVYIPVRYEMDPSDRQHSEMGRTAMALARASGLQIIDVNAALMAVGDSHLDVTHLSPRGHEAVARCIAEALRGAPRPSRD
ncbi:MAG: hypothetical protein HRU71_03010 [Planctomycetia bacterium]|nr:MAG: hypothetical protein HRU71_03010 [Planctomycetia bacterium]